MNALGSAIHGLLLPGLIALTGCAAITGSDTAGSAAEQASRPDPQPASQAEQRASATEPAGNGAAEASDETAPTASDETAGDGSAGGSDRRYVMDAMVGQVNGKPIYASEILEAIGTEQLERLGQTKPRLEFRRQAMELIVSELRSRITNAMILAEAERNLTEQERRGLSAFMQRQREKLLAQYKGVQALAEEGLRKKTGRTIDQELETRRKKVLTDKFLREKLRPRIHVSRRDVERYYEDHPEKYNPAPEVRLRLIVVPNEKKAKKVKAALADGEDFAKVAQQHSEIRADRGGMMPTFELDEPLDQFSALRWKRINRAVRKLKEDEHSDRLKIERGYAWVKLEKVQGGKKTPLSEVFLKIEQKLKTQQFNRLSREYINKLMEEGNYTAVEQMARSLLDVAMARYARPAQ